MSTPMTWQEFERFARVKMSEYLGAPLKKMQGAELPKRFDLVSEDRSIVGDAKYLTLVHGQREPPAKDPNQSQHVQCRARRAAGWRAGPNLSLRIVTFRQD
jgi:hypothetical protein